MKDRVMASPYMQWAKQRSHARRLIGEEWLSGPPLDELLNVRALDLLGKPLVLGQPRRPLIWICDPRARSDQDQALHALGQCQRRVKRDPSTH